MYRSMPFGSGEKVVSGFECSGIKQEGILDTIKKYGSHVLVESLIYHQHDLQALSENWWCVKCFRTDASAGNWLSGPCMTLNIPACVEMQTSSDDRPDPHYRHHHVG